RDRRRRPSHLGGQTIELVAREAPSGMVDVQSQSVGLLPYREPPEPDHASRQGLPDAARYQKHAASLQKQTAAGTEPQRPPQTSDIRRLMSLLRSCAPQLHPTRPGLDLHPPAPIADLPDDVILLDLPRLDRQPGEVDPAAPRL